MNNDTFDRFYNEFKDWSKEDILRRTYNIILDDADKTRQIEQLENIRKEAIEYNEHLIRDAKYHLNLGHLKKMKKILNKGSESDVKD